MKSASREYPRADRGGCDVLCIGTAAFDVFLTVDGFPAENRKYELSGSREEGGGPAANAAFLLSQWGVPAALACVLGDDVFGTRIAAELQAVGTNLSLTELRPGYRTPLSVILVNSLGGSRTILNRLEPGEPLRLDPEAARALRPRALLFDGHQPEASLQALELFPEATTVLDAGSRRRGTELLAPEVDYLVAAEAFALAVSGLSDLDTPARQLRCLERLAEGARGRVAVTLGERGVIYLEGRELCGLPAAAVQAVDTTAAGDVFHGAFLYGLLEGRSYTGSLGLANRAAGVSVGRPGGRSSIPALEELPGAGEDTR